MKRNVGRLASIVVVVLATAAPALAQTTGKPAKGQVVREAGAAECDRKYPDKALCPPQSVPEDQRCENLAKDLAGQSGLTGYVNEQKKTDMRKQYQLTCGAARGSDYECEHLGRDLAGSTGTLGFAAETRKGDLRWLYDRRCTDGSSRQQAVPAIIVR